MLQVESDASFLFLFADSSASSTNKTTGIAAGSPRSMSNQWQPPAWHPHHHRHAPPPSTAAAHLPAPFVLPSPRGLPTHPRTAESSPLHNDHHNHNGNQRSNMYEASYSSNNESFSRNDFSHNSYANSNGQDQRNDAYYSSDAQWAYPVDNQHQHQHHHHAPSQYMKPASEMGISIDPLPLRHLAVAPHVSNVTHGAGFEEDLYEARMLQEALTTPHYTRGHLGGFHHQQHQHHHAQPQHQHHSQYSSPFVSAVLEASVPMPHQQHQGEHSHHGHGIYSYRPMNSALTTPSEHTIPSDSEAASSEQTNSSTTGKRKRRGDSAPRLCRVEGCNKGIRSRGLCKAHGGGRRCMTPGCTTSDQGGGHCVLHGGGRRCTIDGCTKSAQWKGLCKMHGGARRCRYQNCTKNGQVKQGYCRAHHNLITKQREQEEKNATA